MAKLIGLRFSAAFLEVDLVGYPRSHVDVMARRHANQLEAQEPPRPGGAAEGNRGRLSCIIVHVRVSCRVALGLVISTTLAASVPAMAGAATQYPTQSAAFASQVLNDATLPPDSQPTTVPATHQVSFAASPPIRLHNGNGETYDADRLYTVSTAPASVVTYIEHHLAKGWSVGLTEPPSGPPPPGDTIIEVRVPVTGPHEETATVTYTVVPDGTGTEFRVDALVIWLPSRPRGLTAPRSGSVLVTGYTTASLMGTPQKATKVRVTGKKAALIRQAFNRLPLSTPTHCEENWSDFSLTFVPAGSKTASLHAGQASCPSPGVVYARLPREETGTSLGSSCALTRAVVAVLPAGKGYVTRQAARHCGPL